MFSWKKPRLQPSQNSPFQAGERWTYRTRAEEPDSTFVVLRVDTLPGAQNVVHLRLEELRIPNSLAPSGFTEVAGHLPVAQEQVSQSALAKIGTGEPLEWDGYEHWKRDWERDWERGRAGHFRLFLAQIADFLQDAMRG